MMTMYNATRLLDEEFRTRDLKYRITEDGQLQRIDVPFRIEHGPTVTVQYFLADQRNDLTILISGLVNNVPAEKRIRMLEVINKLNNEIRFIKFTLDSDNDLGVRADFLRNSGDDNLGIMAFEILLRIMRIMDNAYPAIARTFYSEEVKTAGGENEAEDRKDLLQILNETQDGINIKISKIESSENAEQA